MKYIKLLNSKPLVFVDKILRAFGYYIELTVDMDTGEYNYFKIRRTL